mgnify:FL=1
MENQYLEIEKKYKALINIAIEKMKLSKDPKHNLVHILDVVEYTKEILETEHEANKEVCIIAAYWHDVGRIQQHEGHELISANELKTEMEKQNYPAEFIEKCYKAICKHSWKKEPETLEGIIIRDADKIDFVGINRWKECIENGCRFEKILELLPTLRKDILKLEVSKEIFDREIGNLIAFLHDQIFNNKY